jgi:hypothetical protein
MPRWRPDQTFYPSSKMAMQAPQEATPFHLLVDRVPDADPSFPDAQRTLYLLQPGAGDSAAELAARVRDLQAALRTESKLLSAVCDSHADFGLVTQT